MVPKPPKAQSVLAKLPGYGSVVTADERAMIRASTVQLVERQKAGGDKVWLNSCTGLKVQIGSAVYVLSARHCFTPYLDVAALFPSHGNSADPFVAPDLHQVQNVTNDLTSEFGIAVVDANGVVDPGQAMPVVSVAVQYYPDVALLRVGQATGSAAAAFAAVPSIDYLAGIAGKPAAGAATDVFSLPTAGGDLLIEGSGYFLGQISDPSDPAMQIYLVGTNPGSPGQDACNFGASGSVAVIAGGVLTGPLTIRNNIVNPAGSNGSDDPVRDKGLRTLMTDQLGGMDLSGFNTLCGYAVLTPQVLAALARSAG